ncbi:SUMF1/EgtB/PvdO family nonheme iron enzyme [Desulfobacterales bacterium HSG17]|nr:SUMF1/EgtB/PvdO family nonheme iron enzyme [Desulfobacterales bacterium HSG17]
MDNDGFTNFEEHEAGTDPNVYESAVASIKAVPGDRKVNLTWDALEGSTDSYVIYTGTQTGVGKDNYETRDVGSADAGGFIVTELVNGTLYYFVVTTKIGAYESAVSAEVLAIPTDGAVGGDYTNGLDMTFNELPAGIFMMGSPIEPGRNSNERPHQVILTKAFYMQTTEVTQEQWEAVMGTNPSYFSSCGGKCPVESVSWNDVQDFIVKMNLRGEGTYRLPTEAEWEYAARAGSDKDFANGDMTETECLDPVLDAIGWYFGNSDNTTHEVGRKIPNAWYLFDMHGNVWEWVEDDWHFNYDDAPADGSAWIDVPRNFEQGMRGGSFGDCARICRSAYRGFNMTFHGGYRIGFRLVFSPGQ